MTFDEALDWLYSTQHFGIKLGLDNMKALLSLLGNPEKRLKFLHVAGTNGKGSVCAFLDAILRAEGYKTGLFTSPHLVDFRERICLNGTPISQQEVAEGLTLLRNATGDGSALVPTFFEFTTALAAWHFSRQNAEIVVWETGLGGRWDATNVVTPLVSVITSIAYDHKQWLGETLAKIAAEKAGIFKPDIPAVSAPQLAEAEEELFRRASEQGVFLRFVEVPWITSEIGLHGIHQRWNAALAVAALNAGGVALSPDSVRQGLVQVHWPGRFQMLSDRLMVDGAHNPDAIRTLVVTWREVFGNRQASVVFGSLRDKESDGMLQILSEIAEEFLFVPVANTRSRSANEHQAPEGISARYFESSSVALDVALAGDGMVLVVGSLFLVGEVLAQKQGIAYRKTNQ